MAKAEKQKAVYKHREDAEWLTAEICEEYRQRARQIGKEGVDVAERRALRLELQDRCDISQIEAINILNGYHTSDYVKKYARIKGILDGTIKDDGSTSSYAREFDAWVNEKEKNKKDDDFAILDD